MRHYARGPIPRTCAVLLGIAMLLLAGCATESATEHIDVSSMSESAAGANDAADAADADAAVAPSDSEEAPAKPEESPDNEVAPIEPSTDQGVPRKQAESCDWDAAATPSGSLPEVPQGQDGTLQDVIIGAWQHTHYDSGEGYVPLGEEDIRYVFPSSERLLYCQHVPGITEHAQNGSAFTWDDTTIVLPGGAPGFVVAKWSSETMVWINRMDDSRYLLQRR